MSPNNSLHMKIELFSEKGKRDNNQDYMLSKIFDDSRSLHIIADGMGGYENGRLAAEIVANTICDYLSQTTCVDTDKSILEAVEIANNKIKEYALKEDTKMGTTIGGAYFAENTLKVFWVGDVKIIHISKNEIEFESRDHSLINQLKDKKMNTSAIGLANIKHIVTRSIQGADNKYQPQIKSLNFASNDRIIICSDGFLEALGTNEIKNIGIIPELTLKKLKERCKSYPDNSSLIVIHIL